MIPRDWGLIVAGLHAARTAKEPGADAPSAAEVAELVREYG
ncbi:hypothetical protein ACGYK5_17170 [Sulfitobacter sp. 1A16787]